tara:strand:+ start:506 stop:619 length:114 start_codon:yes stop_codon:yes gene_type:complete
MFLLNKKEINKEKIRKKHAIIGAEARKNIPVLKKINP